MEYGKTIAVLRGMRRMTQARLAEKCGVDQGYICRIESGKRKATLETLELIAQHLGVPVFFIFMVAENSPEPEITNYVGKVLAKIAMEVDNGHNSN